MKDRRTVSLIAAVAGIAAIGAAIVYLPLGPTPEPVASAHDAAEVSFHVDSPELGIKARPVDGFVGGRIPEDASPEVRARLERINLHFSRAVVMLHAGEFEHAITALHQVLALSPRLPQAHVNMGFALIGLENYPVARDFFLTAIDLAPETLNAYYGLGVALEGMGDAIGAIGAMESFIHRSDPDDPFVVKARAALWEWGAARQQAAASVADGVEPPVADGSPVDAPAIAADAAAPGD